MPGELEAMTELLDRLKSALTDRYAIEEQIGQGGMADCVFGPR